MSQQAGTWNFKGSPVDEIFLSQISQQLFECGPDGENKYIEGSLGMLYRPYHTTQESRLERQPCISPSGHVMTWDGRLDNRDDLLPLLCDQLSSDRTDSAIALAALVRWGEDAFEKLIGDWALTLWDPRNRCLILAVDYVGLRQLYYSHLPYRLTWCSRLAPLVQLAEPGLHLSDAFVAGYLAMYAEAHLTPYREILRVPPGSFVRVRNEELSVHSYWSFKGVHRIRYKADAEYEDHFLHLFRQSVRRRLRCDRPVLAELSGGFDSSAIVCTADDITAKDVVPTPRLDTLSVYDSSDPHNNDDYFYFTKVEEQRGRTGIHIDAGKYDSSLTVPAQFSPLPGCVIGSDDFQQERCAAIEGGNYRVVLSGIGGDEFLGGVPDPRSQLADLIVLGRPFHFFKQLMAWSAAKRRPWVHILFHSVGALLPSYLAAAMLPEAKVDPWVDPSFAQRERVALRQLGPLETFGLWLPSRQSFAQTLVGMTRQLATSLALSSGRPEERYPYLDQSLLEYLFSIPAEQLLRPGERRSLMRRALANTLPNEILQRRTKAIGARSYILLLATCWASVETILESPLVSGCGYITAAEFREALVATKAGKSPHLVRILKALSLELWLRDLLQRKLISIPTDWQAPVLTASHRTPYRNDLPYNGLLSREVANPEERRLSHELQKTGSRGSGSSS